MKVEFILSYKNYRMSENKQFEQNMTNVEVNFTTLIKPRLYQLNSVTYSTDCVRQMTDYDIASSTCKNMLELILRAQNYQHRICDMIDKDVYNIAEIEKYTNFIKTLTAHIHYYEKFKATLAELSWQHAADFSKFLAPRYDHFAAVDQDSKALYLVTDEQDKFEILTKINRWQAYYVTIYNIIIDMRDEADKYGTVSDLDQKCDKWIRHAKLDDCKNCMQYYPCRYHGDIDDDLNGSRTTVEKMPIEAKVQEDPEAKVPEANKKDIENYKLLLSSDCGDMFETASAGVEIKEAKNGYINVGIGTHTLVFHTNFSDITNRQLEILYPCGIDLSKYVIDNVEIIPVNAPHTICGSIYAGFRYNNILYYIQRYVYPSLLACIAANKNLSTISKELTEYMRNLDHLTNYNLFYQRLAYSIYNGCGDVCLLFNKHYDAKLDECSIIMRLAENFEDRKKVVMHDFRNLIQDYFAKSMVLNITLFIWPDLHHKISSISNIAIHLALSLIMSVCISTLLYQIVYFDSSDGARLLSIFAKIFVIIWVISRIRLLHSNGEMFSFGSLAEETTQNIGKYIKLDSKHPGKGKIHITDMKYQQIKLFLTSYESKSKEYQEYPKGLLKSIENILWSAAMQIAVDNMFGDESVDLSDIQIRVDPPLDQPAHP